MKKLIRPSYHLTVVDNGSNADVIEFLEECLQKGIVHKLIKNRRNMGVSVAVNQGWVEYPADFYVKIDNDIEILHEDWLNRLVTVQQEEQIALISYCFFENHYSGKSYVSRSGVPYIDSQIINGGLVLMPQSTIDELGYWNEDYVYGWEDPEYSYRAHLAKKKMAFLKPEGYVEHLGDILLNKDKDMYYANKSERAETAGYDGLYSLNAFMFDKGLRPLKVTRKFVPIQDKNGYYTYKVNPEYMEIVRKQQFLQKEVIEDINGKEIVFFKI